VTGPDGGRAGAQAALLLLVVFGFKAALAPLSVWLPATYAAASAPVAALFAIMTKVGVYAIWRVHGVIFGDVPPAQVGPAWSNPAAAVWHVCHQCALGTLGRPGGATCRVWWPA
jgi:formate hydrogenlyase subunit 3/multisubunit Na+/H+ antiporter MnhD subunit